MPHFIERPAGSTPAAGERRRGYRQAIRATAMLRPIARNGTSESTPIHVYELSISGIGFSCRSPLDIGTVWRFDLVEKRQTPRRAEIRSCRQRPDGMYDHGAQFC